MLSQREKEGLTTILEKLDNLSLASLAGTITKGMIKPETRNEATTIILMYSENAFALLHRKKIKKEILFHYLKDNGVPSPASAEKAKFVMACLKMWESDIDHEDIIEMEDVEDSDEITYPASETPSYDEDLLVALGQQTAMQEVTLQQQMAMEGTPVINDLEKMGQEFVAWFYGLLNNTNVESGNFHSNHFWPDCIMQLQISATNVQLQALGIQNSTFNTEQVFNKVYTEQILGAQNVTDKLIKLVTMGQLFFHPNANHYGVSCFMERHGLVKIFASGVLHKRNLCIGLFDHSFGLVRSADIENNWRIKYTELLLKVKHTNLTIAS